MVSMLLLDALRAEHDRIEPVLGALRTWSNALLRGEAPLADRDEFVNFFTIYAGTFHHEREEELLVPALVGNAGVSETTGPIAVMLGDHRRMAGTLRAIATTHDPLELQRLTAEYSEALGQHIDMENSVFFPESERRLRGAGIHELESRAMTAAEEHVATAGDALVARYPPMLPEGVRGDGCVMCHAYGVTCRGLEREWWNEWEWEELSEHVAAS
jgi:hemerythrin-like domain-containing protein